MVPSTEPQNSSPHERVEGSVDPLHTPQQLFSTMGFSIDPLWTPEQVAQLLNVSPDWVRDHSSRKEPRLPVIRLGGGPGRAGLLRYRRSEIEKFIDQMEQLSNRQNRRRI